MLLQPTKLNGYREITSLEKDSSNLNTNYHRADAQGAIMRRLNPTPRSKILDAFFDLLFN